jgi:hypothetical protein
LATIGLLTVLMLEKGALRVIFHENLRRKHDSMDARLSRSLPPKQTYLLALYT